MQYSPSQQEAVDCYEGNVNVIAAAGSGKSATLVGRIAKLVQERGVSPVNILAVTFSKKAKESMQEKLAALLPEENAALKVHT